MDHSPPAQKYDGVTVLALPLRFEPLLHEADNLQLADDGSVNPGQLQRLKLDNITVYEVPRTNQKAVIIDQYMKELVCLRAHQDCLTYPSHKAKKNYYGWTNKIDWTAKDLVLENSSLSLEDGVCVLIPQRFPGENAVKFCKGKEMVFSPKWHVQSVTYILEKGLCIAVRGKVRFYAITFKIPSTPSSSIPN